MPSPASANVRTQIGVEATPGTAVAATQQLAGLYFTDDPKINSQQIRRAGHASPSSSVRGYGWTDLTPTSAGPNGGDAADFNSLVYALSTMLGAATIALHASGVTAHDWTFVQKLVDLALGKTLTVERGPSGASLGRKYAYTALDALTLSGTKDKVSISGGHAFAREITTGATLTSSVPELAAVPIAGINANVYLDTTSAGLGTTQLVLSEWSIAWTNFWIPKYDVDRSNTSYGKLVPGVPDCKWTFKVEADADAWAFFNYLKAGQLVYPRLDITGPIVVGESSITNELKIDSALFINAPAAFGDDQGVDSIVFTGTVGEDDAWVEGSAAGTSLVVTATNVLSTL